MHWQASCQWQIEIQINIVSPSGVFSMALDARNRVSAVDVLQMDFEYCTISYYVEGSRNDLGETERTLVQRASNVKCSIDELTRSPSYVRESGMRETLRQGIIERSLFIMTLLADQAIEPGDIVTDYDGTDYDVVHVMNWYTHKEAFLREMN